ncbi:MAG TPA: hypothetical protein VFJ19_07300 [Nocardioidaceae bacterium]|nr:hypothetical protein [Nocardioidaceae bacterium]
MSVTYPEAVTSGGKRKIMILTTAPADPAAPSLATDFAAGTAATMYFLGGFAPTGTQNKGNGPKRVGESSQLQVLGTKTFESPTLTYVHDPKADAGTANAVKDLLVEGTEVWIYSAPAEADGETFAANDRVRLDHLRTGYQWEVPSGDDEFAIEQVTQESEYVEPPIYATVGA